MQEVDREFYLQNRNVGKGVSKINNSIIDNNISFLSNHPISSFKGNTFKWNSWVFNDGTK